MEIDMVGEKRFSFEQAKDWMRRLEEDLREFVIKSEGWRKTAQKAGRWFRWAEDRSEAYMRRWYDAKTVSYTHLTLPTICSV